jgi:hypothetical protein
VKGLYFEIYKYTNVKTTCNTCGMTPGWKLLGQHGTCVWLAVTSNAGRLFLSSKGVCGVSKQINKPPACEVAEVIANTVEPLMMMMMMGGYSSTRKK